MLDPTQIHQGLLSYFFAQRGRSIHLRAIREVCYNLYRGNSSNQDPRVVANKGLQEIFLPLLRWGVIESFRNDRFGLGPTAALFIKQNILLVNYYGLLPLEIDIVYDCKTGVKVLRNKPVSIHWLAKMGIPTMPFKIESELRLMRPINAIVEEWPNEDTDKVRGQYFLGPKGWVFTTSTDNTGIYRASDKVYSARTLQLASGKRKCIPTSRHSNNGHYQLAQLYSLPRSCSKLLFDCATQTLSIQTSGFPIILERMLFIHSMLVEPNHDSVLLRKYFIDHVIIEQLNQLIDHKIQLHEKRV